MQKMQTHDPKLKPDPTKLFFVEGFAGTAITTRCAMDRGHPVQFIEWAGVSDEAKRTDLPMRLSDGTAETKDEVEDTTLTPHLHHTCTTCTTHATLYVTLRATLQVKLEDLLNMDILDIDLSRPEEFLRSCAGRGAPAMFHFGFDCLSFTNLTAESNRRKRSNNFMGASQTAYRANTRLLHSVALSLILRARDPLMVISLENPKAALRFHPLISLFEREQRFGGLGMARLQFDFCFFMRARSRG